MSTKTAAASTWRFTKPFASHQKCNVVFAGNHFLAGLEYTKAALSRRNLWDQIEIIHAPTTDELFRAAPAAHVALPFMERFSYDFLQAATQLRLVQQFGVGLEGVDIPTASELGICVSNIPAQGTGNEFATAEHAIFLTLSLLRRAPTDLPVRFQNGVLGGLPPPQTLHGKRVTVVGFGNVGQQVCKYAHTMGAHVTAVRKRAWPSWDQIHKFPGEIDPSFLVHQSNFLAQVLPTTDVLILACPVNSETWYLMNDTTLPLLPNHALVVNVGRGPLVEYEALYKALDSQKLGGFASDVGVGHATKPSEPWDPNDPICQLDNVLFTPHVGGYSEVSYKNMTEVVVDHIECILRQEPPRIWVNPPSENE